MTELKNKKLRNPDSTLMQLSWGITYTPSKHSSITLPYYRSEPIVLSRHTEGTTRWVDITTMQIPLPGEITLDQIQQFWSKDF
jgi:hypothetical protein